MVKKTYPKLIFFIFAVLLKQTNNTFFNYECYQNNFIREIRN